MSNWKAICIHVRQDYIDLQLIYFVYCASRGKPSVTYIMQQTDLTHCRPKMQGRGQQRKLSNCSDLLPGLKPTYNLAATIAYCSAVSCDSALSKAMSTEAGDDLPHERRARNSQSCRECGVLSSCSPRELSCCSLVSTARVRLSELLARAKGGRKHSYRA